MEKQGWRITFGSPLIAGDSVGLGLGCLRVVSVTMAYKVNSFPRIRKKDVPFSTLHQSNAGSVFKGMDRSSQQIVFRLDSATG